MVVIPSIGSAEMGQQRRRLKKKTLTKQLKEVYELKKTVYPGIAFLTAAMLLMSGCASDRPPADDLPQNAQGTEDSYPGDPVTLTVWNQSAGILNDEDLETFLGKPVRNKYPNISFQLVTGTTLDQMITSGEIPDLITTSNPYLYGLIQYKLADNLNEMIKQESIDMKRFEPAVTDALKLYGEHGETFGMPFAMNYGITLYNKAIFDKFGVPYPTDHMTWEQMIELSRRITRKDGADEYIGFDPGSVQTMIRPRTLPVVDAAREKAAFNTEPIKEIFGYLQKLYGIPGVVAGNGKYSYGYDFFQKEQRLGMLPYWLAALTSRVPALNNAGVDWDIVSFPTFADRPQYGREVDFHLVVVTTASKNKKAAYKALRAIVGDEAQREMNRNVRLTVLNDSAMRSEFASAPQYFAGKNLNGIFSVSPAPLPMTSEYDSKLYSILGSAVSKMVKDRADINTVLREAEDEANKYIQEQKTK